MELKLRASGAIVPLFTIKMAGFEPALLISYLIIFILHKIFRSTSAQPAYIHILKINTHNNNPKKSFYSSCCAEIILSRAF